MKTILLLRHGKSDWDADHETDHERPLAKRGRVAAMRMGRFLKSLGQLPDRVISSTAKRANDTARRAAKAGSWPCEIETTPKLYESSPEQILEVIRKVDDTLDTLLLVGHEPTWSDLVGRLVGGANVRFPTAALARIDLAVECWRDAEYDSGQLIWMVTPKMLKRTGRCGGCKRSG